MRPLEVDFKHAERERFTDFEIHTAAKKRSDAEAVVDIFWLDAIESEQRVHEKVHTFAAPSGPWPEAAEDDIADAVLPVLAVSAFERQILGKVVGRTETKPVYHRFQLDGIGRAIRIWDVAARV